MVAFEVLFLVAFLIGYSIDPTLLRVVWLVLTGTLTVLGGIFMNLLILKVPPFHDTMAER